MNDLNKNSENTFFASLGVVRDDLLNGETKELSEIKFTDIFVLSEIQKFQDLFCKSTGVASIITETNGEPITEPSNFSRLCNDVIRKTPQGLKNCMASDAHIGKPNPVGPTVCKCLSGGLWDAGASIYIGDHHIANWLIGQVRNDQTDTKKMLQYAEDIGADKKVFMEALDEVVTMSTERFQDIANMLFLMANQISHLAYQNYQKAVVINEKQVIENEREALLRELESKNEQLERFTYTVSHDLKSPLITIGGFTDVLNQAYQSKDDQLFASSYDRIKTATDKMFILIKELLKLSRSTRQLSTLESVSFSDLVSETLDLMHGSVSKYSGKVSVEEDSTVITCDKSRIIEVVQNLIENAIKYSDSCPYPIIEIFARKGKEETVCSVRDNGIGIDSRYQHKVFELFEKIDPTTEGSGVGLSLVERIVKVHGGRIWVESEGIGKGTTFSFSIPHSIATN